MGCDSACVCGNVCDSVSACFCADVCDSACNVVVAVMLGAVGQNSSLMATAVVKAAGERLSAAAGITFAALPARMSRGHVLDL